LATKKGIPQIVKDIRAFKPQEVNYAYQKNISFSQMSMYRSCPQKWALQYKEGNKLFSSTIHTVFGTALHHVIQHYLDVMYDKSGVAADNLDLIGLFEDTLREEYGIQYKKNNNQHFSSSEELNEFFEDGIKIINTFKSKKGAYFNKKGWYLVGCEIPVLVTPNKRYNNVIYMGYLDVVMYHEPTNTFKIIDIKTSTRGWNDKTKKDENKQFQLILYKQFFSEQFNIPLDSIDVEFFIVKRKVYDHPEYVIPRIQTFTPASGKVKLNKANKALNEFIVEAFNKDGYIEKTHEPTPSKWDCTFCPFRDKKDLCSVGVK
tara:strand:- start:1242 stop:2192 length:951 start_codon:yes stop_codon:yes gene_type:complete